MEQNKVNLLKLQLSMLPGVSIRDVLFRLIAIKNQQKLVYVWVKGHSEGKNQMTCVGRNQIYYPTISGSGQKFHDKTVASLARELITFDLDDRGEDEIHITLDSKLRIGVDTFLDNEKGYTQYYPLLDFFEFPEYCLFLSDIRAEFVDSRMEW